MAAEDWKVSMVALQVVDVDNETSSSGPPVLFDLQLEALEPLPAEQHQALAVGQQHTAAVQLDIRVRVSHPVYLKQLGAERLVGHFDLGFERGRV